MTNSDETQDNPVSSLGLSFSAPEIELGTSFFDDGRAELNESGPTFFEAEIEHFKRQVFVWLDLEGDEGEKHGCDCPHFDEHQTGCEHLWALKLLLDRGEEDEGEETNDDAEPVDTLRPFYLLQPSSSLQKNALILSLHDSQGGQIQLDHNTWVRVNNDVDIHAIRTLAQFTGGWKEVRLGGGFMNPAGPWKITEAQVEPLLRALAETQRLVCGDFLSESPLYIAKEIGKPLELALGIDYSRPNSIRGLVLGPHGTRPLSDARFLLPGSQPWIVLDQKLHPLRCYGGWAWARTMRNQQELETPEGKVWGFLCQLSATHPLPRLTTGPGAEPLTLTQEQMRIRAHYLEKGNVGTVTLSFLYGETEVSPRSGGDLLLSHCRSQQILRDQHQEEKAIHLLLSRGFSPDDEDPSLFFSSKASARRTLFSLIEEGWQVLGKGGPIQKGRAGRFAIKTGTDWFSLTGQVEVQGRPLSLAQLLKHFTPDDPWIHIDHDRALLLDEDSVRKLNKFAGLASFGQDMEGELRFSAEQALLARLVLGDEEIPGAPKIESVRKSLESRLGQSEVQPSGLFQGELRPYQKAGLAWLSFLKGSGLGGCLADEMGLGKTVQVLAFLQQLNESGVKRPFLIVAPLSLLGNWEKECQRFCPELSCRPYHGSKRSLEGIQGGDVLMTSYGILRRDGDKLANLDFEVCILDEAQAIKNPRSLTRAAAVKLRAQTRLALSGTPLENRLEDLWSLFEFLNPTLFTAGASLQTLSQVAEESPPELWRQALRPLLLRRRKEEVAKDLPPLTEQTLVVAMTDEQKQLYTDLEVSLRQTLKNRDVPRSPALMLEGLLRLRQAACHPALLPGQKGGRSGKIALLLDHLEDAIASKRKCLVFSQFVGLLDIVAKEIQSRGLLSLRLDGKSQNRQAIVDEFQDHDEPVILLVSLKVGGVGLNLTEAEVVILLDPWWNPAIESQAIARAHRIGQENTVHAIRMVSAGTIEERILILQEEKRALADSVLEAAPQALAGLSTQDIAALLGGD